MATTKNQEAGNKPSASPSTGATSGDRGRPDDVRADDHHQSATEKVTEKVVKAAHAEDEPMGRQTPEAPFALVGLSYLAALALVVLIVAWVVFTVVN